MMRLFGKRGQSTAEYAILFGLVVAVAIAMQTYVKRSLQGGTKFVVDKLIDPVGQTGQYEPYYLKSAYQTTANQYEETEETNEGGEVVKTLGETTPQKTTRFGTQQIRDTNLAD
ncbi:MAG: class III signal peptide-containing protein [Candidatus Omnitrophica bacterium]|nr:class III signal peptide-containing protein [Candidatus Omnitrophota bacterium]